MHCALLSSFKSVSSAAKSSEPFDQRARKMISLKWFFITRLRVPAAASTSQTATLNLSVLRNIRVCQKMCAGSGFGRMCEYFTTSRAHLTTSLIRKNNSCSENFITAVKQKLLFVNFSVSKNFFLFLRSTRGIVCSARDAGVK